MPFKKDTRSACMFGLKEGLNHARPEVRVDEHSYVTRPEDNLLGGLLLKDFEGDLNAGAGKELMGKFRAVHSSVALAVNCFAPLRTAGLQFSIGSHSCLQVEGFERRFPTGLSRAPQPPLNVVTSGPAGLVAIESRCIEYLTPKKTKFSVRYETGITDERAAGPWYAEMMRLRSEEKPSYRWLGAAQLIKHAFGLARAEPDSTLLYLFWEPMDAGCSPIFEEHRAEIAAFGDRVAGGSPRFEAMSYLQLWEQWANGYDANLRSHAAALRARYEVPASAWECVEWIDGRLCSASWLDELLDNPEAEKACAEDTIARADASGIVTPEVARRLYLGD